MHASRGSKRKVLTNDAVDRGRHRIEGRWRTVWEQTEIDGGQMEDRWRTNGGQREDRCSEEVGWMEQRRKRDGRQIEDRC